MNNNFFSRNNKKNSVLDNSSFIKTYFPPDVFNTPKILEEIYNHINILQTIANKESDIFKSFRDYLGKRFLNVKPASLVLFEQRLKEYFISSNFLNEFTGKKSKIFDEKINVGSLDYYALSDRNYKSDIANSSNKEKILSMSRNFAINQSKDIISQEFFKMKYQKKNAKRIAKILNKKNKNKNQNLILELDSDSDNIKLYFDNKTESKTLGINKYFLEKKRRDSDYLLKNNSEKGLRIELNINNDKNLHRFNSLLPKNKQDIENFTIFEYAKKDKTPKKNNYYWLDTSNINSYRNNNKQIMSNLFTHKKKKINLSEMFNPKQKKFINSRNEDTDLFINKYHTHTNFCKNRRIKNSEDLLSLDLQKIKKMSKKYKININSNINKLDDYTSKCKSKLLRILNKNKIDKKIYIIKKEKNNNTELNELKELLFSHKIKNKKWNGNNDNNNKSENLNQNKFSKTTDFQNSKRFMIAYEGDINKKTINTEIKNILKNANGTERKNVNLDMIREKCKENFITVAKLRENIKFKKNKLLEKLKKFQAKNN